MRQTNRRRRSETLCAFLMFIPHPRMPAPDDEAFFSGSRRGSGCTERASAGGEADRRGAPASRATRADGLLSTPNGRRPKFFLALRCDIYLEANGHFVTFFTKWNCGGRRHKPDSRAEERLCVSKLAPASAERRVERPSASSGRGLAVRPRSCHEKIESGPFLPPYLKYL